MKSILEVSPWVFARFLAGALLLSSQTFPDACAQTFIATVKTMSDRPQPQLGFSTSDAP